MANRIIYPAALYPLQGDVSSSPQSSQAVVTGLRTIPIASTYPIPQGATLMYNPNSGQWEPTQIASIQVNGLTVSTDYWISVNNYHSLISVDGTGVAP